MGVDVRRTTWGIHVSRGRTLTDASPLREQHEIHKAIPTFLAWDCDGGNLS